MGFTSDFKLILKILVCEKFFSSGFLLVYALGGEKVSVMSSPQGLGERPSDRLRAAREGDRNSLEQLVESQRAELLSIAVSQLDSDLRVKESPSDLVQESMIEGIRGFEAFRGTSVDDFGNYLKAILRNNLHDARRRHLGTFKRALHRESAHADPDEQADSVSLTPSRIVQRRDDLLRLQERLEHLPQAQQRIIRLRYWDGLTFVDMARVLGKEPDATRKAFWEAMRTLTRACEEANGP